MNVDHYLIVRVTSFFTCDVISSVDLSILSYYIQVASSALGYGPQMAMQLAERLYTQGFIRFSLYLLPLLFFFLSVVNWLVYLVTTECRFCVYNHKVQLYWIEIEVLLNLDIRWLKASLTCKFLRCFWG